MPNVVCYFLRAHSDLNIAMKIRYIKTQHCGWATLYLGQFFYATDNHLIFLILLLKMNGHASNNANPLLNLITFVFSDVFL